jgi:lipoprotein-anchoring transpeptidase ErfK/SrfK
VNAVDVDGEKLRREAIRTGRVGARRGGALGGARPSARLVALAAVLPLALAGCGGDKDGGSGDGKQKPKGPSQADVHISPKNGADGVAPVDALKVKSAKGKLVRVDVTGAKGKVKGKKVPGKYAAGHTSWKPSGHLATGSDYEVSAVAKDSKGREKTEHAKFTTLSPKNPVVGRYTPEDGQKVGVGMPVSINFNRPVSQREDVEKSVSVSADPEVDVQGHWFGNQRLDFRPEKYWKKGTKVSVRLNLDGVEGDDGVYGTQDKTVKFTVGRSQVSVVDAKSKQMVVKRDGKKYRKIPISSGSAEHPTYNGKMVISEKHRVTRMDGNTVGFGRKEEAGGYDIKDVPHAMRLSDSGTFIHGNYWNPPNAFGNTNLSHGCVGLRDPRGGGDESAPGAWFYRHSMIGDVVQVKNSQDKTIPPDNGFSDWNMDWKKWTAEQK